MKKLTDYIPINSLDMEWIRLEEFRKSEDPDSDREEWHEAMRRLLHHSIQLRRPAAYMLVKDCNGVNVYYGMSARGLGEQPMTGVLAALESASRQVLTKPVDDPLAGLCLAKEGGVVLGVDGFDGFTAWDRLLDSVPNLPCFFLFLCSPVGEAQKLELRDYYNRLNHFYGDFRSIQIVTGKGTQQVIKHPLAQVEQLLKQVKMKEQSLIRPGNGDGLFQVTMWYGADTKQHAKQAGEHLAAFSRWSRELLSDREQRICALDRGIGVDREDRSVWVPWASWYENGPRGLNNLANLMTLDHVAAMLVPPQEQRPGFYVRST